LGSQLSLGASYYHQAGVQIDYSGGGSPYASILPTVDLNIYALALLAKYQILANMSLIGGTKYTLIKDASADIFKSIPIAQSEIKEAGEFGTVLGVAYEKPEIALRVELLYEAQTKFSLETDNADLGSGKSIGSVPNYFTLNLQSGVYKDTLAFASFHHANWSENQLRVHPQIEDTSSFIDSLTYSLGLAYKISEKISIYSNFSGEEAKDSDSTSLLSITDGYYGFSFGGRYLINHLSIGLGVNQTYLGDVDLSLTGLPIGEFKDNTITSYGVKLAYNFN